NLLELSIAAARAGATVGEMSAALETTFNRHIARAELVSGVYAGTAGGDAGNDEDRGGPIRRLRRRIADFTAEAGRSPKILVAKVGQDGHDRGQKVIASGFGDLG